MRFSKAVIAAVLIFGTADCATQRGKTSPASPLTLDCVALRAIERWRVLDPYHVIVYTPDRSAAYLMEFSEACVPSAVPPEHIELAAREEGRLCARGQDALLVNGQRCVISTILRYKIGQ
jgi:hypothetical protein